MQAELMDLWLTRIHAAKNRAAQIAPHDERVVKLIESFRGEKPKHLLVKANDVKKCVAAVLKMLEQVAYDGASPKDDSSLIGYLGVHVPVSKKMDPQEIIHRLARRLYFSSTILGLGEVPDLRDTVQSFRLSYLQTRGKVTESANRTDKRQQSGAGEVGGGISLAKGPLINFKGNRTASEEISLVEGMSATMDQAGFFETEDNIISDLAMLGQLDVIVTQLGTGTWVRLPRMERIRRYFKEVYAQFHQEQLRLRPVFVFDAHSPSKEEPISNFLEAAQGLTGFQGASLIVLAKHDSRITDERFEHHSLDSTN